MQKETIDTRQFSVSPHIIYSLIKAQAGTLAKGLLECIMNSVDAGATKIDIQLTNSSLTVTDNGKGFKSRAEIEACFEVFGFEHSEGEREYGQFGIGRAQLWNFCSTVWHTNEFRMDVDIKNRGLDYNLVENVGPVPGLKIEGTFYEALTTSEILACERELKELAMFVNIPVTLNGTSISQNPLDRKWTYETDDAWIFLSKVAGQLTVYNLGVKVRDYSAYTVGIGGLVVTKPGVRLALNMARNDILTVECKVWKRIKPFLQEKTNEAIKRSPRLTEEQLANLANQYLAGTVKYEDIKQRKLIRDIVGGSHTLAEFFDKAWATIDQAVTYVSKDEAGPTAEATHKQGYCFVLSQQSLQRFGVSSASQLMELLEPQLIAEGYSNLVEPSYRTRSTSPKRLKVIDEWKKACTKIVDGYTDIPHKDWTRQEQAAMSALRATNDMVLRTLLQLNVVSEKIKNRELRLGVSDVADAWTDGVGVITIERSALSTLDSGTSGAAYLVSLLVHEYLHEGPSSGTHIHDEEFYERFHQVSTFHPRKKWGTSVGDIVNVLLVAYMKECSKRKVHIKMKVTQSSNNIEAYGSVALAMD